MNIELLKKIRSSIEENPSAFDQSTYGQERHRDRMRISPYGCNSAACIAGWAVYISNSPATGGGDSFVDITDMIRAWVEETLNIRSYPSLSYFPEWIEYEARDLLDLTEKEAGIFFSASWPVRWRISDEVSTKSLPNKAGFYPDVLDAMDILDKLIKQGGFV